MKTTLALQLGSEKMQLHFTGDPPEPEKIQSTKRHCNAAYELHVILRGSCRLELREADPVLTAGTAVLIPPGLYHAPVSLSPGFSRFVVSFSLKPGLLLENLKKMTADALIFQVPSPLCNICQDILLEHAQASDCKEEMLKSLMSLFFIRLFRVLGLWSENRTPQLPSAVEDRTGVIDNYFAENFSRKGGEEDLARQLHLSKRQLARVLKQHYGMSYQQKLISTRMDHAALLMRSGELSNQKILEAVGYSSEAAFYQVFRKYFQMTPRQYRERFCMGSLLAVKEPNRT